MAELEAAARVRPSAEVLGDLSAAYLALAEDDRPWLLVDAVAAAARAVEASPGRRVAAFNLALALEHLALPQQAMLEWERYLELGTDADWRREASDRLARLRSPTPADSWEKEKELVGTAAASGDEQELVRLATKFRRQVQERLEGELLARWAEALGTPAEAERLQEAKRVAASLAASGDRLHADIVSAIERPARNLQALAAGHRAYARGLASRGDCSQAEPEFRLSEGWLSQAGSPLAWAARLQRLTCTYRRQPDEAEASLARLASEIETLPYPALLGTTEALRGLCAMVAGEHSAAVAHYERAAELLATAGETEVARVYGMLDEAYRFLGARDLSWSHRLHALRLALGQGDRRVRHAVLTGLARELVATDRRVVAHVVLGEMLANARAWAEAGAEVETLLRRIQLHHANGATELAAADLEACTALLDRVPQPADRERLRTELIHATAEQRRDRHLDEAVGADQGGEVRSIQLAAA